MVVKNLVGSVPVAIPGVHVSTCPDEHVCTARMSPIARLVEGRRVMQPIEVCMIRFLAPKGNGLGMEVLRRK